MNGVQQITTAPQVRSHDRTSQWRIVYWSLRRELWESRSIYIVPIVVVPLAFIASIVRLMRMPAELRAIAADRSPAEVAGVIQVPYDFTSGLLMFAMLVVALVYALDALYGERRDRSILFWKSLPVSDLTTVLTKASVPIVIVPLVTFVSTVMLHVMVTIAGSMIAATTSLGVAGYWAHLPLPSMWSRLLYHLITIHGLSWAPFFGWLLFVSAFARRPLFVWAALPPLAIALLERIAFGTSHFTQMLASQAAGGGAEMTMRGSLVGHAMPGDFLSSPGLWFGLVLAAVFIAAAVRLRRSQVPV